PDGTVACTSLSAGATTRRPTNYGSAIWARQAVASPVSVAPIVDPVTGAHVAVTAVPIPNRQGFVAAFTDLTSLGPHLASLYSGGRPVEFLITSGDGRTAIARSLSPSRWSGASLAGSQFASASSRVERKDLDGTTRLYGQARVVPSGWRLY